MAQDALTRQDDMTPEVRELPDPRREPTEVRFTLKLSLEAREVLDWIAAKRGGASYAEIIRRAIGTEKYLMEVRERGGSILIEEPNKRLKELVIR